MSWDVILPFLRPIEGPLRDPEVTDILVNASGQVFAERHGRLTEISGVTITDKHLRVAVCNIARVLGDDISEEKPLLDARLPDGSRVAAVLPPCSVGGVTLAIRKFQSRRYDADDLVRMGALTPEALATLTHAVLAGQNILISGGTGTGKTTVLNALAGLLPEEERIVVIEDVAEIRIAKRDVVRLEARRAQAGLPEVTIRDLLRTTLRLRPDRILVGEIRGGEAFDLLEALNTGHGGTLSTIHANSTRHAVQRLTTCVLQAGVEVPYKALRAQIADSLQWLVHLERRNGRREVTEVASIVGYDADTDRFAFALSPAEPRSPRRPRSVSP